MQKLAIFSLSLLSVQRFRLNCRIDNAIMMRYSQYLIENKNCNCKHENTEEDDIYVSDFYYLLHSNAIYSMITGDENFVKIKNADNVIQKNIHKTKTLLH